MTTPRLDVDLSFPNDTPEQPPQSAPSVPPGAGAAPAATGPPLGFLLDEPDEQKVFDRINDRWKAWDRFFRAWEAYAERNERWRAGEPMVRVVEVPDQDLYYVWPQSPGYLSAPQVPNKCNTLVERVCATLMVDPPLSDCEPASDSDEDRAAAEFSTRVLTIEGAESGLNIKAKLEEAIDLSSHLGSAFLVAYVDPQGGGWVPREVLAHPKATDANAPTIDPATGLEGPDFVLKYVGQDEATLQDDALNAAMRWLPSVCATVLTPRHVRFWDQNIHGLDDSSGVILAQYTTVADLKTRFPPVASMDDAALQKIVNWRPKSARRLLPPHMKVPATAATNPDGTISDDALACTFTVYMKGSTPEYPKGAYLVVGGGGMVFVREPWTRPMEDQSTGGQRDEVLDIPIAQVRQFRDTIKQSPYGRCLTEKLGPPEEIRKSILGAGLEYLFRFGNPHVFLPVGSVIQPDQLLNRDGSPILVNPQGKPEIEDVPPFPEGLIQLKEAIDKDMDSDSGLEQAAQGVNDPSVQSGVHAQTIVEQALVAIGAIKRNSDDAFTRFSRIQLQLYRAFYDQPRKIRFEGPGASWKEREWSRADLRSTKDVRIARGTSTMLPQSAKQQLALSQVQAGVLSADDAARAIQGNVSALVGAQDNPHRNRIQRRIDQWRQGPPPALLQQVEQQSMQMQQAPQAPQLDPMTGQPIPPPDPLYQAAGGLFRRLPCDDEQAVAQIHFVELSRAMAGSDFGKHPDGWQHAFIDAYQQTRAAAGISTVAEQQQMQMQQQQQQMQQQQDQAAQQGDQKKEMQAATHAHQSDMASRRDQHSMQAQQARLESQAGAAQQGNPNQQQTE